MRRGTHRKATFNRIGPHPSPKKGRGTSSKVNQFILPDFPKGSSLATEALLIPDFALGILPMKINS